MISKIARKTLRLKRGLSFAWLMSRTIDSEAIAQEVEIPVALKGDSGKLLGTLAIHRSPLADESRGRLDDIESNDNRIINCA